jgi:hypothetical protein
MEKKEVKYTERDDAKYVAKKSSWVRKVKIIFLSLTAVWFALAICVPLRVKNTYSGQIKKSIVVSMFFDLQQGIAEQYAKLLGGVRDVVGKVKSKVDFDTPVNAAVDKIKLAQAKGDDLQRQSASIRRQLSGLDSTLNAAKKFGIKTGGIDSIAKDVDNLANAAAGEVQKINRQLDDVKSTLRKAAKEETDKMFDGVDKMVDSEIRGQLDKATGGMSGVLLTKYNVKSIAPWRPSTWPVSAKIYAEIERSSASTVQIIMRTVDGYFGYAAWGLVAIVWAVALLVWFMAFKKVRAVTAPFIVCPNCGHAFSDKRTAAGLLKLFKPWTWL